jgi:hypothetical protein
MDTVDAFSDVLLSIVLPGDRADDIIDAWCANEGYVETISQNGQMIPNPVDKTTFTIECLRTLLTRCYVRSVAEAARIAAEVDASEGL